MRISINQACKLTGKHRSTVTRVTDEMQSVPGRKNALLYDSRELLQRLYVGADGAPTASEALRLLTIARTAQVRLQTEQSREKWWPYAVVKALFLEVCTIFRQTLIGNENKILSFELINDILRQQRDTWGRYASTVDSDQQLNGEYDLPTANGESLPDLENCAQPPR